MNNEIENKADVRSEKTSPTNICVPELYSDAVFCQLKETSKNENVNAMLSNFSIENTNTTTDSQPAIVLPKEPIIEAKNWFEHPKSPADAAKHAYQEIKAQPLGLNLAEQGAADWLNDTTNRGNVSESTFRTQAANAYNQKYGDIKWAPAMNQTETFSIHAVKKQSQIIMQNN